MSTVRNEIDAGIDPESELEERSLSIYNISVNRRTLRDPKHSQDTQRILQDVTLCQIANWVSQPLIPENQALQRQAGDEGQVA